MVEKTCRLYDHGKIQKGEKAYRSLRISTLDRVRELGLDT